MKCVRLWVVHFSGLLRYRPCGGIVFDVVQRMMAPFITRQQHDNIPHVDRTPYSPQRSGGSAWPFLPELSSRSPSPLARELSPNCCATVLNYIWISTHSHPLIAWLHIILCCCHKAACEWLWQNPHWKKKQHDIKPEEPWCTQPNWGGQACSNTNHCISLMPLTAKSNHKCPWSPSPRNLIHPTKMKNEQYYHFTDSCQEDFNRIRLRKRSDIEILL